MDYKIVDRVQEKETIHCGNNPGKWQRLFKDLPYQKAVEFRCPTKVKANKMGTCLHGCFRAGRHQGFTIRSRIFPDGNEFVLYCWKVQDGH